VSVYDSRVLREYRQKVAAAGELRKDLGHVIGQAEPTEVRRLFDELTIFTKEMETLRSSLGERGVFLARYGYERINDHTVSFVLPQGCSRIQILQEAQALVTNRDLIGKYWLERWSKDDRFCGLLTSSAITAIDGNVDGGCYRTEKQQIDLLRSEGLEIARQEDVAVAFALNWVASGESLFGVHRDYNYHVRAAGGWLFDDHWGLVETQHLGTDSEHTAEAWIGVAARLPLESKS
jgi:hypothetical protein